jgi:hypothetical protein
VVEGQLRAAARAVAQSAAIEARLQLKWWQITGAWPRGAQVRRVTSSEAPDSSQNTMAARRRRGGIRRIQATRASALLVSWSRGLSPW